MSWYNPLSWGGDAARYLAEETMDAVGAAFVGLVEKIKENPVPVAATVVVLLGGVTSYNAAKTAGQNIGKSVAVKIDRYLEAKQDG